MSVAVVYLDKLFIGNLLVNYLILWVAGGLGRIQVKHFRIIISSSVGSFYSLALFLPGTEYFFTIYSKIAVSLIMLLIAFAPLPPIKFLTCMAFFYLVSFTSGGMVIGFGYFISDADWFWQIANFYEIVNRHLLPALFLVLLVLWTAVAVLPRYIKAKQGFEAMRQPITIFFDGRGVTVRGLVDTGNSLCDPVSGEPVVVVEHRAIRDLLPEPMKECEICAGDAIAVIEKMMGTPWSGRLRLIPYHSIGNDGGILLGIKPDRVEFVRDSQIHKIEKVVIGVNGRRLDAGEEYNAIINPVLFDRAVPA